MDSIQIINHITTLEARCQALSAELEVKCKNSVDINKFYAVSMTTEEVAKLHGISPARVRDYANRGLIELHPNSTDAKMLFRASDVLTLDFSKLRREKSLLKR